MPKVGIVMGSDSDIVQMSKAADILDEFDIEYDMQIISAHREPDELIEWCRGARDRGIHVIIAGAGMAAALPGMCAALFNGPVIGVPLSAKVLDGTDALYSMLQMPPGVPVAVVAIDGAKNAGLLAAQILSTGDGADAEAIAGKLASYKKEMKDGVVKKNDRLQEIGHREYIKERK
ncbi:MAG: 5-(carboxyamino)imidazole ribonucleotide mutase [Lachnospiraceae bacterium]|nr:5-(carboxyamino)imidazole ribonucleotide mutase [Lachnospiraceae bacterium]MBQ9607616.1 5-(carboxyamino)imidazole ribonucleotide mutase [Lachnospiraceae bacterium]MBR1523556.1 5-(carboxyamino)imidazole ribonucleotide mutase [Lachnospiraceae bacterium]